MLSGIISSVSGAVNTSGDNVSIDSNVQFVSTDSNNIAIGQGSMAGATNNNADSNVAIGVNALTGITSGDQNIVLGSGAGGGLTTSSDNIAIGHDALADSNCGDGPTYNVAIGTNALKDNTGVQNIGIGAAAGKALAAGVSNTIVGHLAGQGIDGQSYNTIIGNQALSNASSNIGGTVAIGYLSLGQGVVTTDATGTTAIGYRALTDLTSGNGNTVIGHDAGYETTSGGRNTVVGYKALYSSLVTQYTVAVGYEALLSANEDANDGAVAIGYKAGRLMNCSGGSTANGNTLIGYKVAFDESNDGGLTSGTKCTAVGMEALGANANGSLTCARTTVMGYRAGYALTGADCDDNVFIGYQAGDSVTTGTDSVIVGSEADLSAVGGASQIVIGKGVTGSGDNTFTFGVDTTDTTCTNGGTTWSNPSDKRIKQNIKDSMLGLSFIKDLRPVTFEYKEKKDLPEWHPQYDKDSSKRLRNNKVNHGFIAQEVKEAMDKAGHFVKNGFEGWGENEHNELQRVGESAFIAPLIKAVQELSQQIEDLKKG